MSATILESTVTPTGTQVSFIKDNPDRLKAFVQADMHAPVEIELTFSNGELPSTIQLGIIHDPKLRVIRGIPVDIRRDGDTYVASWEQAEEFGYGANRSEALE